jgi:TRAP-type C4-dicarboxylate transport system permease small subunit
MLGAFGRLHDAVTAASFAAAAACVAVITGSFAYEVVARYFFGAPTSWAYDLSSYALCPMIFLAIPAMTQQRAHIAVAYLVEGLPSVSRHRAGLAVAIVAMLVCFFAAWITGAETWRQYANGVETISANPISKWWVSIFIPYGLLSSALYFMRQGFSGTGALPAPLEGMPQ